MSPAPDNGRAASPAGPPVQATDPLVSAWVSANAGSGKTYVLARRVIRLLLGGVEPGRILCLTFTRAAAAEMAARVFGELSRWAVMDDAALAAEIAEVDGRQPSEQLLSDGRRLFARALDTPGGLKIQTIHAFCERLLHQFPFEANVAGRFEVLEDIAARALRDEARRLVWVRAAREPRSVLGRALATALAHASDFVHEASIIEFVERRDQLRLWIDRFGSLERAIAGLIGELGLVEGEDAVSIRARFVSEAGFGRDDTARLHELLGSGGKRDRAAAARLAPVVSATNADLRAEAWLSFFTTKSGDFRVAEQLVSKGVCERWPDLTDLLTAESTRLEGLVDRLRLVECYESSAAMIRLADGAITEYAGLKRRRGVLDFEDLVVKTAALLSRADASAWVHYKLDRGLDHILVDEAQDTNPRQWQVVEALAEEFFAGEGASEAVRTVFAVGDEKQSIYSFQGAVPAWFGEIRKRLRERAEGAGYGWHDVRLHVSHRSTPAVLSAVDQVFARPEVHDGVTFGAGAPVHEAARRNQPGRVTIWPQFEPPDKPQPDDWATPLDHLGEASPEIMLATRISDTIAGWLRDGERLEATGESIRARDILILTRTRGALTEAINRRLKTRGVPIAGIDRLALTEHIVVMDLLALGRIVHLPQDDLALAAVLKSPLIGLDDEALFTIAHDRHGALWSALTDRDDDPQLAAAAASLSSWMRAAQELGPHAFYSRVAASDGGRRAFLERLGPEADDVLDEFLSLALNYERANVPTIQGFVSWLAEAEVEVKRDADTERDQVRVMTVHGAKGLEAGIVFLVDNGSQPVHPSHDPRLLALSDDADPLSPSALVWNRSSKVLPRRVRASLESWRERARREYRRLLYVGMTRARDRLVVCGMVKRTSDREGGWHALVRQALEPECRRIEDDDGWTVLEWSDEDGVAAPPSTEAATMAPVITAPPWLGRPAPPPERAIVRVTASSALEPPRTARAGPTDGGTGISPLDRGRVVHRLLQSLPDRRAGDRRHTAQAWLNHIAPQWPSDERIATVEQVLAILDDPAFAPVFLPGSRAEVDIAGRDGATLVSGRIDRLTVTDDHVLIVDYKTNRVVPERIDDVDDVYIGQLAHYCRILGRIYATRTVEAGLLWTSGPVLMTIPEDVIADVSLAPDGA